MSPVTATALGYAIKQDWRRCETGRNSWYVQIDLEMSSTLHSHKWRGTGYLTRRGGVVCQQPIYFHSRDEAEEAVAKAQLMGWAMNRTQGS